MLREQHCKPVAHGSSPLAPDTCQKLLSQLDPAWALSDDGLALSRQFTFQDFHHTMAFVNAVAWIAHREDHHPELQVGYKHLRVDYTTHAAGGLTENDFICAAHIDHLLQAN
jgi:4a-hydroxytetrahydrobiopterin dehydratase